jgi:hypothetical protein
VHLYVPANTPIGTPGLHAAAATIPGSDPTPADNAAQRPFVVFGSYDPNDKLVEPPTMDVPELLAHSRSPTPSASRTRAPTWPSAW